MKPLFYRSDFIHRSKSWILKEDAPASKMGTSGKRGGRRKAPWVAAKADRAACVCKMRTCLIPRCKAEKAKAGVSPQSIMSGNFVSPATSWLKRTQKETPRYIALPAGKAKASGRGLSATWGAMLAIWEKPVTMISPEKGADGMMEKLLSNTELSQARRT